MIPPSSNTGGKSPSRMQPGVQNRTKIDALAFTARGPMNGPLDLLERHLGESGKFDVGDRKGGFRGYDSSALVTVDGMNAGVIGWGGKAQRDTIYVSLMGTGCRLAGDVGPIVAACSREDWRLSRIDIAADFTDGSVSFETCQEAADRRGFYCGGRPPKIHGEIPLDGSTRGRTMYVGDRRSDKFGRFYEKGLMELPMLQREVAEETGFDAGENLLIQVDGEWIHPSKWFRGEVELGADKRPLPPDIVERRDQYFAGAYPYLAEILPNVQPAVIVTPRRQGELALESALFNIQRQYGSTLFTALVAYEGDMGALLARIMGDKHNEALVRAGALLGKLGQVPA